ncbi:barstar family protein [Erwinia tasmaniensis]|uniref:barstar family protein n=1 Tax=Erwinia tasmaniensis TaxID=338565 RepID=UPI003A4D49B8
MKSVSFDFRTIADMNDFYRQFAAKFALQEGFGANLDALWDALTGSIGLPVRITLHHLAAHPHAARFDAAVAVMREAQVALEGELELRTGKS